MAYLRQFSFKKFGYQDFGAAAPLAADELASFIKVVFVAAGGHVVVDFQEYDLAQDALFFINAGQYCRLTEAGTGTLLYYNRDFYCVEIHDKEVACDGILFHNVYEIPLVPLDAAASAAVQQLLGEVKAELAHEDSSQEEMLRILLKQLIIKATRRWKQQHAVADDAARQAVEFARTFSQLVEWHYPRLHAVADYAALLHLTPKALSKRLARPGRATPNDLIKNRIVLEAKRLLVHTRLSVKEIGYKLGYEDTSYFVRLFTRQATASPQTFRHRYQAGAGPA